MTAAFDATRGTDQRFTDALSGSDGTADPSVMMPVLDVYPDALSAPMPVDVVPVVVPPIAPMRQPGVRAEPVRGPGARPAGGLTPAQQRMAAQRPAPPRPAARQVAPRPAAQQRPVAPQMPVTGGRPPLPTPVQQAPHTFNWQGRAMSASDIAAMVRASLQGQPGQVDRQSFQATHPQSMGSAAPAAVAPAAPMASQYSGRGQARNDAREQGQERRRTSSSVTNRGSSVWAVIVFLVVIGFATGIVQQIWNLITELLNQ
jgi:hypothetical protein